MKIHWMTWILFLLAVACQPYRTDKPEGHAWTPSQLATLHQGMTSDQVRFVLGQPDVEIPWEDHQWHYIDWCWSGPQRKPIRNKQLVLSFDMQNKLEQWQVTDALAANHLQNGAAVAK